MRIIKAWPPNIGAIKAVFPLPKGVIFTYGNVIYNPYGGKLGPSLLAHEAVHEAQQEEYGIDEWWQRYLVDAEWRLGQEVMAHRVEWKTFCNYVFGKAKRDKFLFEIASHLASPMYGNLMTIKEAVELIKK